MAQEFIARRHKQRHSLRSIYIHHIIWGAVCLVLLALILGMWLMTRSLDQKSAQLEHQLALQPRPSCSARNTWTDGSTRTFSVDTDDGKRSFLVHLPDNFTAYTYYPLVLFFPGKGMNATDGERLAGLDRLPVIAVYPEPTVGRDSVLSWQGAPYSSGVSDVQFVSNIMDKVQGQLCIDRTHVYAVGLSNGGGMASLISCRMGDRFAAIGIVAGALYNPDGSCQPDHPTPLINIHGDDDPVVPYMGSQARQLPPIEDWMAARASDNDCNRTPKTSFPNAITTVTTWQFCRSGATVENIRLHGVGHVWQSDMTEILWNFLSSHSL